MGSFGGMFRWNPVAGTVIDCTDGKPYDPEELRIFSSTSVSGYSDDLKAADEIIFDYVRGAVVNNGEELKISAMPELMKEQPMALWNFALELHVGRCYSPFIGPLSVLFVFLAGLLLTLTLISGYIIMNSKKKKKHKKH